MEIAAIIPTRGQSRKVFTHWQVERAHLMGYDKVYLIDYTPTGDTVDLIDRIHAGVNRAIADGIHYVSILEDDDWYDLNYIDAVTENLKGADVVGFNKTTYYHLFNTGYKTIQHPGRSSMFCTSFRTDLFDRFPKGGAPFHDIQIWKYVMSQKLDYKLIDKDLAIGIKHGRVFGKVAGAAHNMGYDHSDPKLQWLRERVDPMAFQFYKELKETFQQTWAHGTKI